MPLVFQFRRDEAAAWITKNPVLADGEPGVEEDTGKFKLGDGKSKWSELEYFTPTDPNTDEDGPSFALLYQNAKV